MWWLVIPLSVAVQAYLLNRQAARYYLSPTHDAVLAVVATGQGWHVEDHVAAWPGIRRGRALRALVLPELRAAADTAGIPIYTTAVTTRMAAQYAAEIPGLVDVGQGWPRGRKMRREVDIEVQGRRTQGAIAGEKSARIIPNMRSGDLGVVEPTGN